MGNAENVKVQQNSGVERDKKTYVKQKVGNY